MEAYGDDIPLLILSPEPRRKDVERGALHGVAISESFRQVTKAVFTITAERELLPTFERAYTLAAEPRRGPVVISIAYDLLERSIPENLTETTVIAGEEDRDQKPLDASSIERALNGKERPVVIAGKALMESGLGRSIGKLIDRSRIPLFTSVGAKGIVPEDHEWVFGDAADRGVARKILEAADTILAIGTRLRRADTKNRGLKLHDLVHIDVDGRWLGRNYQTDVAVSGGMKEAVEATCAAMKGRQSSWDIERLKKARVMELAEMERSSPGFRIIRLLRHIVPRHAVTVWDPTLLGYWAERWFPVFQDRGFLSPQGVSPTFYALPAAIGARLGRPESPCLCVTGDGSFLPVAEELSTIAASRVPVVVLLYNNGSFGVLEDTMRRRYGTGVSMKLSNPDFVLLARSFGIRAERAETLDRLEKVFKEDISWDEPFLVEFRFPLLSPPW
jgi:acetolactate synthase-1/2/3 large subunit